MKSQLISAAATLALAIASATAGAQTVTVDLDAKVGGVQQSVSLTAGTYEFAVVSGTYDGWTYKDNYPFYREAFSVSLDGGTSFVSIDVASSDNKFTKYASQADALAAFASAPAYAAYAGTTDGTVLGSVGNRQITFSTPVTLSFAIPDDLFSDNSGGVSLAITAVPEPQTYALLLGGLALVGGFVRRRRGAAAV